MTPTGSANPFKTKGHALAPRGWKQRKTPLKYHKRRHKHRKHIEIMLDRL